jgi:hypothetical protein
MQISSGIFIDLFYLSKEQLSALWQESNLLYVRSCDSGAKNRVPLFDVELYLTVHKSFVSISLNIIHRGCTFHLSYLYWTFT